MMVKEEVNLGVIYEFYILRIGREVLYIFIKFLVNFI